MSEGHAVEADRTYPTQTAGHLMVRGIPMMSGAETTASVRMKLTQGKWDLLDPIWVADENGGFVGAVELPDLFAAGEDQRIDDILRRDWPHVDPETDQEHVATIARGANAAAVAVTDAEGHLLGCVPPTALLTVIWEEHVEDMHRLAGIVHQTETARHAIEDPPLKRSVRRLPWLLVGVAGSFAATAVMVEFEAVLSSDVRIAFFIPAIVYLADAMGTQTEAVAIRGLSLSRLPVLRILANEILTGGLIGAVLSILAVMFVGSIFGDLSLGLVVGVALFTAGTVASGIGLLLPWLLSRIAVDPAFGSGPLATIIQDVLSLLIYFVVAVALVLP